MAAAVGESLAHLFAVSVAVHARVVLVHVVVHHSAVACDESDAQSAHVMGLDVAVDRSL